ncbi:dentin sialophosphoprotein-like isoform X2 [Leptopilina boulardi]|uniref:dentin sialophosphoprotein-like isoform X2 n=1 Tax=Leptopilina boulardi TaxID=63433 RepID=UPI0021F54BEE|nr:dentin sialophosphoprotein-like isoform X2 [Leptopilina boulardi]
MFRKRTRLTSQVWTVIFLLLFNDALTQTTESIAKISTEESSTLPSQNRTVLRKFIADSKTKISSNEKNDSIFTNSTNFQDEIERSSTSKQKDLNNESIKVEKIETEPVKTFDSLDRTTSADSNIKSKLSKNNVSDKTLKLVPDEESLPKLSRNKSKSIFLDAFKEGTRHNVKKSEIIKPEFEGADDYEIEEHEIEHKEPTTQATNKKESLEDFDIEASKKEERIDDKEEGRNDDDDSFSLVNDTNVNFKKQTIKNETNLISENDDSIDIEFGPKNDVEVVQNITRSPIMRIVQAAEEKKGFVNNDKSFIDKKIIKQDNGKNFTKKIEGEIGDSVNDVDLKNDEKVKIDISSKPLPSTKIEISAKADIPLFKLDISSSKIDISTNSDTSSSKTDVIPTKTEISKEIDKTEKSSKIDIFSSNTDDSFSKLDSSKVDDSSSKIDIFPSKTDVLSTKLDISKVDAISFKEDLTSKAESLSKITANSSLIDVLPKRKETKESTENLSDSTKINDNISPAPKARTISFSGINEFIPENIDSKIATTKSTIIESSATKRPLQLDKEVEVKPYPYLKTDIKKTIDESKDANKGYGKKIEESTEEVLAYENTIGRKESDTKSVITEPSVVIENSIQQFKPTYFKRSGNSTKLNSTISDFGIRTTTTSQSIENDNITSSYVSSPSTIKINFENKEITPTLDNEQKIDLTENGITETNLLNINSTKRKETTAEDIEEKASEIIKSSTESKSSLETLKNLETSESIETTKLDNPTVQHSKSINTTESSTEHSITNKIETDNKKEISTQNTTESSLTESTKISSTEILNLNKTEVHVNSIIPTSIELPETTTVEYEFIGLKETTVPADENNRDFEASTTPGIFTNSRPTDSDKLTVSHSNNFTESTISTDTSELTNSGDTGESTNFSKSTISEKSSNSDKSTNSEESSTFSYILRDGTTEIISESNTQSSNEETTIITINTEDIVTELINKFTPSTDKVSEGRSSTSEDKSSTENETLKPDEMTTLLTTTLISNQETTSETTLNYDGTTIITDIDREISKNTTASDSKQTNETTVDQQTTTDTTLIWTSTSAPNPRIVSVTSENTVSKSITEVPTVNMPTLPPEDIRIFVRIVFESTWNEVCPNLESIREMIANLLTTGANKIVSPRQVIFYQTQCTEGVMALTSLSSSETPLTSLLIYIVDEDGNFDELMTKLLPNLYKVSMPTINFPLPVHSFLLVQETDSGNAIAVIVVSSVAFICLVLLAGLLFIMRKRQTRFNYGERCRPVSLDAYSLDSVSAYNSVRRKGAIRASKRSYGNPTFEDSCV